VCRTLGSRGTYPYRRRWRTLHTLATGVERQSPLVAALVDRVHIAVHDSLRVTLLGVFNVFVVLFVHVRVGCGEGRVDILWHWSVLGSFTLLHPCDVGLLERSVLVQSTANKIS
jgi:hypothetical protein